MTALNQANLSSLSIPVPRYDRSQVTVGIVHFGVGGFHRAHQAMYIDQLMEQGKALDWGICGVGVMPFDLKMKEAMQSQDRLYTLVEKAPDGSWTPRIIGSIVQYLYAPDDPDAVIEKMKAEGPTAEEIQKATAGEELAFLRGLESNLGKSMRLSDGAGFHGDAGYFRTEYAKGQAVTAADVKRVANKYLTGGRVVLSIVPLGKTELASKAAMSTKVTVAPDGGQCVREPPPVNAGRWQPVHTEIVVQCFVRAISM